MGGRILLKGGVVLTFDAAVGDFEKADVLIKGKKIVAVQPNIRATATVIDASRMIVLPGFIDSHHHCYQGALRNIQTNGLLEDYSRDIVGEATQLYRPEDAYAGELISALRALQRALVNERAIAGEKGLSAMLTAREVIGFATVEGAKCTGLDRKGGTLTPGKEADVVMLRTDLPNVLPFNNAYGAIVAHMDTSNLDTVLVAVKVKKRAGKLVGVDMKDIGELAERSRN
jgi:cytosine/adenosine deaminase-related metal-dependent hydrolase